MGMPQGTPADTLAGEAAAPEAGAVTADGLEVCRLAMEHLGTPYRYGGSTVKGFDCSGFARFIYKKVGVELPRSSVEQARYAHHVPKDELRVGDLLCFNNGRGRISHVGIYIGHGDFIHSTSTGGRVQIDSLDEPWWTKSLETIRRVLPD
ncbi:MAG: C40 family peptidase [bacterium]|nr:C40 family peptidase [bacterium]